MINIYRSAKPEAVYATKKTNTAFWLCAIIYITIGDHLQVAYYLITVAGVNHHRCTFSFYTVRQKNYTENTEIETMMV